MTSTISPSKSQSVQVTSFQNAEGGFKASAALARDLERVLVDLIALQLVAKQAHWNIVGANFRDLHLNLDEVVAVARRGSDEVAERMRALHATPDGRPSTVAGATAIPDFPPGEIDTHDAINLIVVAIDTAVASMREVHDSVDSDDPTSADILHDYIAALEQQAWFVGAELRHPKNTKARSSSAAS